jgi:prefoldin subunit 5
MTELQQKLETVFKLVSSIPVTGDSVDVMAAAREQLRGVYKDVTALEQTAEDRRETIAKLEGKLERVEQYAQNLGQEGKNG